MRRLITLGAIALVLLVHTVWTDRATKSAEPGGGGRVVRLDGGDLFVKDQGDRDDPVIVLLHGFACSQRWWDRVTPDLVRRGLRVIRFDLLGHGRSEMPRDGYAPDKQADLVAAALKKLRVRRATVAGHSMGGTVASALAQQKPGLVRGVAVLGTPPRDGFVDLPITADIATWPVLGELTDRLAPDALIKANLDSAFADDVEVPDEFVDDVDGMTYSAFKKSGSESDDFVQARPTSGRIPRGDRVLVIFGAEDEIVDPKAADRWARDVPRARVVKLPDTGHSPHWERPRDVVELLLDLAR